MARILATLLQRFPAVRLALGMLLLTCATLAQAVPSACAALWGLDPPNLKYWNGTTWVTAADTSLPNTGSGTINALGGYEGNGSLYFTNQVYAPATMHRASFDNANGTITFSGSLGVIGTPTTGSLLIYTTTANVTATATPTVAYSYVGATFDRDTSSRRMFLYATMITTNTNVPTRQGPSNVLAMIGLLDPESPGSVSWKLLYETQGAGTITYPFINTSGDIFADQQTGQMWIVNNTNPNRMLKVDLNYTGLTLNSAQVVGTATVQAPSGTNLVGAQQGVGVDPLTGLVYLSTANGGTTVRVVNHEASPVVGTVVVTGAGVADIGNCVAPPDPPTVTKSFNPTTATTPGTSVLTITVYNPNKVPLYTSRGLTDTFPSNMAVHTTPGLTGTCYSDGTALSTRPPSATITGVAGATSVVIAGGAFIPGGSTSGGSCSFSVRVSATIANLYNNTIPAGSLTTTAGSNTVAATSTFQVQNISLPNAPLITKSFNPTTSTATVGTVTLTIVITNPNTVSNTLTAAMIDVLPANMRVANAPTLTGACFSNGVSVTRPTATTITGTVGSTSVTIALNSVIPGGTLPAGGSCSFSVRVSQTVAGISANSIPVGSLTTVSGSNVTEATATYYLRASDFSVIKSQREGDTGATTTANIEVASGVTISYVISIRNSGGVAGTRTFTDTLPALITPTISMVTATVAGATGCRIVTSTVAGPATRIVGTVTGAPDDGGCDITIVAKASVTSAVSTATNVVFIGTVTGAVDTDPSNNTSTVVLVIKPAANLTITKDDGRTLLLTGSTNAYTITVANAGPAAADGAILKDPAATGLNCTDITCSESGGATCPLPAQLFVSALQSGTGLTIPTFPSGGTVTFVLSCTVTATGEP